MADRIGPYALVERLGQGAMGVVWRAEHVELGRAAAVKLLQTDRELDPELIARFRREAEAATRVSHPGVVRVYDFGEDDGTLYLAMELVEGESLTDAVKDGAPPIPVAARWIRELLLALEAIHAAGLVHRDLKPPNLMIDAAGKLKVLDLGLVRHVDRTVLTAEGARIGTPRYMAPEVWAGGAADARTDLYAAGLILHELISGERAFSANGVMELCAAVVKGEVEPLPDPLPAGAAPLVKLRDRLICVQPRDRYQTAREALDALAQLTAPAAQRNTRSVRSRMVPTAVPPVSGAVSGATPAGARAWIAAGVAVALAAVAAFAVVHRRGGEPPPSPASALVASGLAGELSVDAGPRHLTVRFRTARPLACTLSIAGSPRTTSDPEPVPAHALAIDGLEPGQKIDAAVLGPDGTELASTSRMLPSGSDTMLALHHALAFAEKAMEKLPVDFAERAPDRASRRRLFASWKHELLARCAAPEFVQAVAGARELGGRDDRYLAFDTARDLMVRREHLRTLNFYLAAEGGEDPGLPWRDVAMPVLARVPDGARPVTGVQFGDGGAGAGRPALPPAPWLFAEKSPIHLIATGGFLSDGKSISEYQVPKPPAVPEAHEAWVAWRMIAGRDTEKITVRWNSTAEEHGQEIAFLWGPQAGKVCEGAVPVDYREINAIGHLGLTAIRRSADFHMDGFQVDHVVVYVR